MKTYEFNNGVLTVYSNTGVKDYCRDCDINPGDFNQPVVISKGVESCFRMFEGCTSFNQPITIPEGVENCKFMFEGCKALSEHNTDPGVPKEVDINVDDDTKSETSLFD